MIKNRKLCLSIIGFLSFFLSLIVIFLPFSPALAATTYQWNTTSTIKDSSGGLWFSYAHERVQALNKEQWGSTNYSYICEALLNVFEEKSTPDFSCLIKVNPANPLKGTIQSANSRGATGALEITLTDPNGVAPAPLEIIERGWLIGQIIPDPNISLTNLDLIAGKNLWLKKDGATVGIDGIGGLGSPNYRNIYKDGNDFYYVGIDISKIPIDAGEGIYGLYAGEYQLTFSYSQGANCLSGEMETAAIDIQTTCQATIEGTMNFFLERTSDGDGKISIYDNNDSLEVSSSTNGKILSTIPDAKNGTNIYATLSMDSPLDKALSNAIKTLAGFVGSFMKTAVMGINELLDNTADIVLGDGVTTGVESAWTKIRNIALTLLIMALTIIAFANVLQIDIEHYGLNRMIPKIIISIIMAYLSWLIVTFFFDFTKALQEQATGLLSGSSGLDALADISINTPTGGDIMAKAGSVLVLLVLLIGILICLVVLWFSLLMRVVVLSFLLAVAPLAFILNIMPFTSKLYKQWWSEFFKWMFMGPIAVTIIALGSIIASSSFQFSGSMSLSGDSTSPTGSGWNMLIGLLILGASIYFAATLPQKWGGKLMGGWQKAGKNLWGKTGGAAWKASSIPGAYNTIKGSIGDRFARGLKQRENKLAFKLSGERAGIDPRAMKRSLVDAQAQTYRKQFETARVSKDELNDYAINSKGPKALAAWQILQDKDWMPSDPADPQTQSMWDKYYADNGIEAGDSLYWGNRKKHPQLQDILTTARSRAGAAEPNPKLSITSLMGGMGDADYPDIEKDALKLRAVASKLALTEKRAESLKPEQVDALTGNSANTEALKTLLNHAGPGGKSFKDGLAQAIAANNSGAVSQNLDVIRERVARDFGDAGIQHLDDKSLLNLINKRF